MNTTMNNTKYSLNDLLFSLTTVGEMSVNDQYDYFHIVPEIRIIHPFYGLYHIINNYVPTDIIEIADKYRKDKLEAERLEKMRKVQRLADDIGIETLYAIVVKIRGKS